MTLTAFILTCTDNHNRGNRVEGLATRIDGIQEEVVDANNRMLDSVGPRVVKAMDKALAHHGIRNVAELDKRLQALMTPQEYQQYIEMVQQFRGINRMVDDTMMGVAAITFIMGTMRASRKYFFLLLNYTVYLPFRA